jgi:putative transposase
MSGKPAARRKLRQSWNEPGHAHELTFSCYRRWPLLSKDLTRTWFIEALDRARQRRNFALWGYVIMPEHAHVLLHPREPAYAISSILKSIKQPVSQHAMAFLRKHDPEWLERLKVVRPNGRVEYRFWQQGGGYDRNVHHEDTAWTCVEYIHANPVRRELCAIPTDWPWSSARWYEGLENVKLEMDEPPPWPSGTRRGRRRGR